MAEVRASACRYGAHCAGVMAPACSLDVWLPRKCCDKRGGPPSLVICPSEQGTDTWSCGLK